LELSIEGELGVENENPKEIQLPKRKRRKVNNSSEQEIRFCLDKANEM
jgi:hypothetical protein